jgi:hypothetical protein
LQNIGIIEVIGIKQGHLVDDLNYLNNREKVDTFYQAKPSYADVIFNTTC